MIDVEQLSKRYGRQMALEAVSFRAEPGEILGLLGPNGAGKTTTMRILTGYLPADAGQVRVAGVEVGEDPMAVRRAIGYLPEQPPLYPEMTVADYLGFVARIKGVAAGDRPARVRESLRRCGLEDRADSRIAKLSKGYRQRVGLAQALVHEPPVIILDEPTVGLDPRQILDVRQLIRGLAGRHTVLLSSHILPEVSACCDRVAILNRGRLVATDRPELLAQRQQGRCDYELLLSGAGDAAACLGDLPGVARVEPLPSTDPALQQWRVVATENQDPGDRLAPALLAAGFSLREQRRCQVGLEAIFLDLITREDHSPEADGDANLAG